MTFPSQGNPPPNEPQPEQAPVAPRPIPVQWQLPARIPGVTYALLGITILFYLLQTFSQSIFGSIQGLDPVTFFGAKINEFIKVGELWRLITPILLHGSPLHILFNMYALFILGRGLEQQYGHERFLELYLIAGFAGNVASFVFSANPSIGASTAIFGLISAQTIFVIQNRQLYGKRANSALINNVLIIVVNIALGLAPGLNIDIFGHLGGLIGGWAFAWFGGPAWKLDQNSFVPALKNDRPMSRARWTLAIVFLAFSTLAVVGFLK